MSQKWKIALIVLAFVALPVLYTLEVDPLNRTLHGGRMVAIALVLGIVVGVLLGYRFQKMTNDAVGKIRSYAVSIILAALIFPLFVSLSNRLLSFRAVQNVQVEFVEESPRYSSRFGAANGAVAANAYLTFFYKDQDLLRIQTRQSRFSGAKRGDLVILPIKKGLWGFDIVQP